VQLQLHSRSSCKKEKKERRPFFLAYRPFSCATLSQETRSYTRILRHWNKINVHVLNNSAVMDTPKATRAQTLPGAQQQVAGTGRERRNTRAHAKEMVLYSILYSIQECLNLTKNSEELKLTVE
jgi:hypothetical protein